MSIEKQKIPYKNNFYASFCNVSKRQVKEAMENNGWSSRKISWTDFELINEWSELVLEDDESTPLLNGFVVFNQAVIVILDTVFNSLNGSYTYEFYSGNKDLIYEKRMD
jgi:hypothetical protein